MADDDKSKENEEDKSTDTEDKKPPEDKSTDPEALKWKEMARKHEREAKAALKKLQEHEDKDKTDAQKAADRATEAEKRAQDAELRAMRLEVAATKGLTPAQAKRLVGSTQEELESDADEFLESIKPGDNKGKPGNKPTEDLKGGGDPTEDPEEMDGQKLAGMVPRY